MGIKLENVKIEDLGRAKKVTVERLVATLRPAAARKEFLLGLYAGLKGLLHPKTGAKA